MSVKGYGLDVLLDKIISDDMKSIKDEQDTYNTNIKKAIKIVMKRQIIEKRETLITALMAASTSIGHCLNLASKIRYPQQNKLSLPTVNRRQQKEGNTVIVQPNTPPQNNKTGFWGPYYNFQMEKIGVKERKVISDRVIAHTQNVVDEIRILQEARPLVNRLIDMLYRGLRRYDRHPKNKASEELLHLQIEDELLKTITVLSSANTWAMTNQKTESRMMASTIVAATARIAEAEALRPEFPRYGGGPAPNVDKASVNMMLQQMLEKEREKRRRE